MPSLSPEAPAERKNHIVSLRLRPDEYLRLSEQAAADHRSLGSFARLALLDHLDACERDRG